jgi:hypothetical protein
LTKTLALANKDYAFNRLRNILLNWELGAVSLETLLPLLKEHWLPIDNWHVDRLFLILTTRGEFGKVSGHENFLVIKTCLEADLKAQQQKSVLYEGRSSWLLDWWKACHTFDWDEAKTFLYRLTDSGRFGKGLLDCALVVTAERLLRYLMEWLEARRASVEPLSNIESEEASKFRDAYITILDDFREKELDVEISWYKYALQIAAWNEAVSTAIQDQQKRQLREMEKDCEKYAQLRSMFKEMEGGVSTGGEIVACPIPGKSNKITVLIADLALICTAVEATPNYMNATQEHCHNQTIVECLLAKWRSGDEFESSVLSFRFSLDCGAENLFNLVEKVVPESDKIPFTKTLLGLLDFRFRSLPPNPTSEWWRSLLASPTWDDFLTRNEPTHIPVQVTVTLSPEAIKLISECILLLVAEHRIIILKALLNHGHSLSATEIDFNEYDGYRQEYVTILKTIRDRKMEADQSWFEFLIELMDWDINEWGDEL